MAFWCLFQYQIVRFRVFPIVIIRCEVSVSSYSTFIFSYLHSDFGKCVRFHMTVRICCYQISDNSSTTKKRVKNTPLLLDIAVKFHGWLQINARKLEFENMVAILINQPYCMDRCFGTRTLIQRLYEPMTWAIIRRIFPTNYFSLPFISNIRTDHDFLVPVPYV